MLLRTEYFSGLLLFCCAVLLVGCGDSPATVPLVSKLPDTASGPGDAAAFVLEAEQKLAETGLPYSRAVWLYRTYITTDTEALQAETGRRHVENEVFLARAAARFDDVETDQDTRRKLDLLKRSLTLPPPPDAAKSNELAQLKTELASLYNTGKYCAGEENCQSLSELTLRLAASRDADELLDLWRGWRQITPPMRALYSRQVTLANEGARALGYSDVGVLWRSQYDMPAADFEREIERLWLQVKPLYKALHCHVRARLGEVYGSARVPQTGPIPAHLLGNMWAQDWGNIYDLVAPAGGGAGLDVTAALLAKDYSELDMVRSAEGFFTSLGMQSLPDTFYERSLFKKPADREVACHASAHNLDQKQDVRIKMCIRKTGEDFSTIHHELGHDYYYLAYNYLPLLYRYSANDGFHEAIGDTIALSVTPGYLQQLGLIEQVPSAAEDLAILMQRALEKVAFLPFGLMMDQWRWKVFSGEVVEADYNQAWWLLREKYQGVAAPLPRGSEAFDPGAKYHIPANTPYMRYFLAHILQFQFHQSLCEIAGAKGPLHRCSIYGNPAAGARLQQMLALGRSQPWPQALAVVTGTRQMDAAPLLRYFAPLKRWLDEQNRERQCGW